MTVDLCIDAIVVLRTVSVVTDGSAACDAVDVTVMVGTAAVTVTTLPLASDDVEDAEVFASSRAERSASIACASVAVAVALAEDSVVLVLVSDVDDDDDDDDDEVEVEDDDDEDEVDAVTVIVAETVT